MRTIHIDGSQGEGGGQVLRTCAALAARAGVPIQLDAIRAGRPRPGLRPQHVAALDAVRQACGGTLEGATVGSDAVRFTPGSSPASRVVVDVGTAGATTLILHALLPLVPSRSEPLVLDARGGTDTRWAPTLGHLRHAFAPIAARAGIAITLEEATTGFFSKGGGRLVARLEPRRWSSPMALEDRGVLDRIEVHVRCAHLPDHVGERLAKACARRLQAAGHEVDSMIEPVTAANPGVVVDAIARYEHTRLAANALGEKGVPSETIGQRCAERLLAEIDGPGTVDVHVADQLIPLVYGRDASFIVRELTGHLATNLDVCARFVEGGHKIEPLTTGGVRVRCQAAST